MSLLQDALLEGEDGCFGAAAWACVGGVGCVGFAATVVAGAAPPTRVATTPPLISWRPSADNVPENWPGGPELLKR